MTAGLVWESLVEPLPGLDLVQRHRADARPSWALVCRSCAASITFAAEAEARRFATIDHRCRAAS